MLLEQTVDRTSLKNNKQKNNNMKPKKSFLAPNEESVEIFSLGQDAGRETEESLRVRAPDRHRDQFSLTASSSCYSSGRLFVFCPNRDYESAA